MLNYELQHLLSRLDPNIEIDIHLKRGTKLYKISDLYIGNEKYLPNGNRNSTDKIIIEVE